MRFISLQPSEQISASSLTTDWHASLRFNSFAVSLSSYVSQGAGYESPFRMIHYLLLEGREGTSCWLWFPINFNQCNKVEFPSAKLIMERESFQGSSLKELIFFFLIISHPKSTLVIPTIGNVEKQKKISHQKPTIPFLTFGAECLWNFNCYSLIIKESSTPCPHHRNLGRSFSYVLEWISNYLTWLFFFAECTNPRQNLPAALPSSPNIWTVPFLFFSFYSKKVYGKNMKICTPMNFVTCHVETRGGPPVHSEKQRHSAKTQGENKKSWMKLF